MTTYNQHTATYSFHKVLFRQTCTSNVRHEHNENNSQAFRNNVLQNCYYDVI